MEVESDVIKGTRPEVGKEVKRRGGRKKGKKVTTKTQYTAREVHTLAGEVSRGRAGRPYLSYRIALAGWVGGAGWLTGRHIG